MICLTYLMEGSGQRGRDGREAVEMTISILLYRSIRKVAKIQLVKGYPNWTMSSRYAPDTGIVLQNTQ